MDSACVAGTADWVDHHGRCKGLARRCARLSVCELTPMGKRGKGGTTVAWHLEGTYFENCPCDMVCPCSTSGFTMPADAERCQAVLIFHVDSGEIAGIDVSGLSVGIR